VAGKATRWANPAYAEFIRQRGPALGFQSQELWRDFCAHFGISAGLVPFRNFATRIKNETPTEERAIPATIEEISRIEQDRLRENFDKDLLKKLKAQKATTDALIEAIGEIVPKVPKAEIPRLAEPKTDGRPQTALLILSDIHIGQVVNESEVQGLGGYNFKIFQRRKKALIQAVR